MATAMPILQPGVGPVPGDHYLRATPDTVLWGRLPCATDAAVLTIASGESVTFDTVSHEGILEDQGSDPPAFFGAHGVPRGSRARRRRRDRGIACRATPRLDGPHVVTGPST